MLSDRGDAKIGYGAVLSFDFDTSKLKDYYSKKSPQGAYEVIKRYLLKHGFEHKKDSDYVNENMDITDAAELVYKFAKDNKWFAICANKVNITPNVKTRDLLRQLEVYIDNEYKKQKDKEKESNPFEVPDVER